MPKSAIAAAIAEVEKKHGLTVGAAGQVIEPQEWLTTGNLGIDYAAGGGIPLSRTVELYGPPSSGKTTTGLQAAAALQRKIVTAGSDQHILYLDHEHALDRDYCAALGLDTEHESFLLAQPYSLEQGAESALKLLHTGLIRLVIFDSVAAMAPIARLDGEFDQRTAAMNKARLMAGLMLQITPLLHKTKAAAIFINHLMEAVEMNARPGMPPRVTTPGGKALKFYASLRLEYRQIGNTKTKAIDPLSGEATNQTNGTLVKVKCVKNKVADPFREAEVRVSYGRGFDNAWSALQVLLARGHVKKTGAWYKFTADTTHPGILNNTLQGETAVLDFANAHLDWADTLVAMAAGLVTVHGGAGLETGDGKPVPDDEPDFGPSDLDTDLDDVAPAAGLVTIHGDE